jgi:hypothetical protein
VWAYFVVHEPEMQREGTGGTLLKARNHEGDSLMKEGTKDEVPFQIPRPFGLSQPNVDLLPKIHIHPP